MNDQEIEQARLRVWREKATFALEKTDRLVRRDWGMFASTRQRWLAEGWNGDMALFQLDPSPYYPVSLVDLVGIDAPISPPFDAKILWEDEHFVFEQTTAGAIEKFPRGMKRHDEVMPQYWRNPVTCRADWEHEIKPRLDPDTSERWTHGHLADDAAQAVSAGVRLYEASAIGAYMYLRALLGPEEVLYAFYDDPDLIHDMMRTWLHLLKTCLLRVQAKVPFFKLLFGEDIAYKNGLLISPAMIDTFLTPYYLDLIKALRRGQAGPIHFEIDSDGNMNEFLPIYMKMGFDVFRPFEIAANNDLVAIANRYPDIVMCGGIDKRILGDSPEAIEAYLAAIMPAMAKRGGFIPTCDHSIPSSVPFANYLYYRNRMVAMDGCR